MKPVRIQLSRRGGFNLQRASRALNGLPAINIARPGKYGNPFTIEQCQNMLKLSADAGRTQAVIMHRYWLQDLLDPEWQQLVRKAPALADLRAELRGHNLACFCGPEQCCHGDYLLEIANA